MAKDILANKKDIIYLFAEAIYNGLNIPIENFVDSTMFFLTLKDSDLAEIIQASYDGLIYFCMSDICRKKYTKEVYFTLQKKIYKGKIINDFIEKQVINHIYLYLDNLFNYYYKKGEYPISEIEFITLDNFLIN